MSTRLFSTATPTLRDPFGAIWSPRTGRNAESRPTSTTEKFFNQSHLAVSKWQKGEDSSKHYQRAEAEAPGREIVPHLRDGKVSVLHAGAPRRHISPGRRPERNLPLWHQIRWHHFDLLSFLGSLRSSNSNRNVFYGEIELGTLCDIFSVSRESNVNVSYAYLMLCTTK